jgi:hypothetical protein
MNRTDILAREIRSAVAAINNGLATRKAHPTYGHTKTGLRASQLRLEGMLLAHALITDQTNTSFLPPQVPAEFGIDLNALAARIDAA